MKLDPLYEVLREAFPPTPIAAADAFRQRGSLYCDRVEYERHLEGRTWEQLDRAFFRLRADGLFFLGADYFVVVLPLYLHLLVTLEANSPVAEVLVAELTKPARDDEHLVAFELRSRQFEELANALSPRQSAVVATALRQYVRAYSVEAGRAQRALDRYWHRFCPMAAADDTRCECVTRSGLHAELRAAFPAVPLDSEGAFAGGGYWRVDAYREAMTGRTWLELDPLFFCANAAALAFLAPRAVAALLPLYLDLLVAFPSRSPVALGLLHELTRPAPGDLVPALPEIVDETRLARFEALTHALTSPQRAIVAEALRRYIAASPADAAPAKRALDRWPAPRA